jgi:hypothetical protein
MEIPEKLARISYNNYEFNEFGFLMTHLAREEYVAAFGNLIDRERLKPIHKPRQFESWKRDWIYPPSHDFTSVPMVDPLNWEMIARFLGRRYPLRILMLNSSKVQNISLEDHPALSMGEFYGRVPIEAIISDNPIEWVKDDREIIMSYESMRFFADKNGFRETLGYAPRIIN